MYLYLVINATQCDANRALVYSGLNFEILMIIPLNTHGTTKQQGCDAPLQD